MSKIIYPTLGYLLSGLILNYVFGPYSILFVVFVLLLDLFLVMKYGNFNKWKNTTQKTETYPILEPVVSETKVRYNDRSNPKRITITLENGEKKRVKNPNFVNR